MKSRIKNKLLFCIATIIIFLSGCVQNDSSEQITESSTIENHRVQDTKTLEDTETLNTVVEADILEKKKQKRTRGSIKPLTKKSVYCCLKNKFILLEKSSYSIGKRYVRNHLQFSY